jgi:hypothetical protein
LSGAAKQLSGTRPGIICAHMLDLTPAQLLELHDSPKTSSRPTALHAIMGKLLGSKNREHVHTIRFSTPGLLQKDERVDGNIRKRESCEIGPSFTFTNNAHPLASDLRMKIFY